MADKDCNPILVQVVRSGFVESVHRGSVTVLDLAGKAILRRGEVVEPIFPRSSTKPLQAVGMVRAGLSVDDADLALVAASHPGEPTHIARGAAMLRAASLDESALACPPAMPLDEAARDAVARSGGGPSRLAMPCSGNHAGMVRTCLANGWPLKNYCEPDHPLQRALRTTAEELAGEKVKHIGVDGCGGLIFALSLTALARAFLALVSAPIGEPERRVADAMRAHPELVGGPAREDTQLMTSIPGLLSKCGAEGVHIAAMPGVGAVAVKIDDGGKRACIPVLLAALRYLGVVPEGNKWTSPPGEGDKARVSEIRVIPDLFDE